ncbi:hypothetical protein [Pelotomaculum propionicicum]|uniref:AB hydrolase-1 domain-containing protein n=1 Tax=Pelotomaculum propionicicum TaxID=258475 RepID=A0A4Y7RYS5_9FIRM|nr:hypothetical protein [Pelotomaculum propionicicum]TEB13457.1 hypothetical protein Pmgp_00351 [Pelotomaculum propionicicum]
MILFVHGMGHSDDRNYWQAWSEPLRQALAGQGIELNEDQFAGVYYYDLVPGPREEALRDKTIQLKIDSLRETAAKETSLQRFSFAKGIETAKKFANIVVDSFGDIFTYLCLDQTHWAVNNRLYESIDACVPPVVLVGYSLGAIVSYCALKQNETAAKKVSHLIMVGSPLYWFKQGVLDRVDLDTRPAVGRMTNVAGVLDIALPQMVPKIQKELDEHIEFTINPFDPVKGHKEYFYKDEALTVIAGAIKKGWV